MCGAGFTEYLMAHDYVFLAFRLFSADVRALVKNEERWDLYYCFTLVGGMVLQRQFFVRYFYRPCKGDIPPVGS